MGRAANVRLLRQLDCSLFGSGNTGKVVDTEEVKQPDHLGLIDLYNGDLAAYFRQWITPLRGWRGPNRPRLGACQMAGTVPRDCEGPPRPASPQVATTPSGGRRADGSRLNVSPTAGLQRLGTGLGLVRLPRWPAVDGPV